MKSEKWKMKNDRITYLQTIVNYDSPSAIANTSYIIHFSLLIINYILKFTPFLSPAPCGAFLYISSFSSYVFKKMSTLNHQISPQNTEKS